MCLLSSAFSPWISYLCVVLSGSPRLGWTHSQPQLHMRKHTEGPCDQAKVLACHFAGTTAAQGFPWGAGRPRRHVLPQREDFERKHWQFEHQHHKEALQNHGLQRDTGSFCSAAISTFQQGQFWAGAGEQPQNGLCLNSHKKFQPVGVSTDI